MIKKMILAVIVGMMAVGCLQTTGTPAENEYKHSVGECVNNNSVFLVPVKSYDLAKKNTHLVMTGENPQNLDISHFEIDASGNITAVFHNCSMGHDWYYIEQ